MDPPELASEPPRSRIGAASNSARAFKSIGLGNVRAQIWCRHPRDAQEAVLKMRSRSGTRTLLDFLCWNFRYPFLKHAYTQCAMCGDHIHAALHTCLSSYLRGEKPKQNKQKYLFPTFLTNDKSPIHASWLKKNATNLGVLEGDGLGLTNTMVRSSHPSKPRSLFSKPTIVNGNTHLALVLTRNPLKFHPPPRGKKISICMVWSSVQDRSPHMSFILKGSQISTL